MHLLKSSTCFEHYPAHLQEVYVAIVYMHISSLSAGDCPVHRLRESSFSTGAQESPAETTHFLQSDDTRGCIYTVTM